MITKEKYGYQRILALIVFCLCLALALPVQAAKNDEPVTTVILVRHGQTDYNKENRYQGFLDIPLNKKGLAQADQLAASLKDVHIDVFIASPLKRAYVTTEKCAKAKGMEISYTDERLKEINYGKYKNGQWKLVLMNSISHTGKLYNGQNK